MSASVEFILGLLDQGEPAYVAAEDFDGVHGRALWAWRGMGFLGREPERNPVPTCPHCFEGVPYRLGERHLCNRCRSRVDPGHLLLWRVEIATVLQWLAEKLELQGGVRQIEERLWQLGTWRSEETRFECFYRRPGRLADSGAKRLAAYRNVLLLYGATLPAETVPAPSVSLLEMLRFEEAFTVTGLKQFLRTRSNVRFDSTSGALFIGDVWLGEVPARSKECYFLACLAQSVDHFVPYSELKHAILRQSGSKDETEEATFCQGLKSRIKKKWIARIDDLIATTNKGDGYRLRARVEL